MIKLENNISIVHFIFSALIIELSFIWRSQNALVWKGSFCFGLEGIFKHCFWCRCNMGIFFIVYILGWCKRLVHSDSV